MANKHHQPFMRPTSQKILKVKRTQRYRWIMLAGLFVLSFIIYFFFTSEKPYKPNYQSEQNDEGFYYYSFVPKQDYYYTANHLTENLLKEELRRIISSQVSHQTFDETSSILEMSDLSITDPTKLWNLFDGLYTTPEWDDELSWMRMHVWPNTRLGVSPILGYQRNIAADLHNIRAIRPSVYSFYDQRFYSDGSGVFKQTDDGGFYPGDEHKGDVARILLYMAVRYSHLILSDDDLAIDTAKWYTSDATTMGKLSLLLAWHKEDPVDDFERQRNETIYRYQNNRNPFIDKPEYVHLIWENKTINDLLVPKSDQELTSFMHQLHKMHQVSFIF